MDQFRAQQSRLSWILRTAAISACAILAGCASDGVRAVMDMRPRIAEAVWTLAEPGLDLTDVAGGLAEEPDEPDEPGQDPWEGSHWSLDDPGSEGLIMDASVSFELLGEGPSQLDPGLGPVDLGYALLVDLGAGDAPYDDGVETILAEEKKRGGFSDTVIQFHWRHRVGRQMSFHGGASMFRYQDLGILDGLSDARFGWAVLGVQFRF